MSDRKYSQKGYQDRGGSQDGGGGRRESRRPQGPRDRGAGPPRGRGLGKPTASVFRCAVCGQEAVIADLTRESTCSKCHAALHTCTHCKHFDTSAPGECRQDEAAYVSSKAKPNTCDFFQPRTTREFAKEAERADDAKAAFDALFDF